LISADLSGANLSDAHLISANLISANLSYANLSGANLSGAVVEKARFGMNLGLVESIKINLIQRGAIFEDYPGERSKIFTHK
jgi:uncharacterized protein YjbI with pentapeptide repeats